MRAQKENLSPICGVHVRLPLTNILYVFSLMVGIIGTYFSLRSHIKDETDMTNHVLYSITLMFAGVLLEAGKISESPEKLTLPSVHKTAEPLSQEESLVEPLLEEEKLSSDILTVEHNVPLVNRSFSATVPHDHSSIQLTTLYAPLTRLQRACRTGLHLFSAAWFAQALSLAL